MWNARLEEWKRRKRRGLIQAHQRPSQVVLAEDEADEDDDDLPPGAA
ncbi:MAG TPA: hypothetical protein VFQ60_00035 [Patescibacteria group bacterium]|nr:hypothetical protein [Patescibacteria group bacterium]